MLEGRVNQTEYQKPSLRFGLLASEGEVYSQIRREEERGCQSSENVVVVSDARACLQAATARPK